MNFLLPFRHMRSASQKTVTLADLAFLNGNERSFFHALAEKTTVKAALTQLIPDADLIRQDNPPGPRHVVCYRDAANRYAFIYTPAGVTLQVNTQAFGTKMMQLSWFDPQENTFGQRAQLAPEPMMAFKPPTPGRPWVLTIRLQ